MIAEAVKTSNIPKAEWRFKISWNIEPECTIWRFQFPVNVLSDGCFVATNKTGIMLKPHFKVFLWNIKKVETRTTFFFTNKTSIFLPSVCIKNNIMILLFWAMISFGICLYFLFHIVVLQSSLFENVRLLSFNSRRKILRSVEITNDLPGSPISNIQNSIQNSNIQNSIQNSEIQHPKFNSKSSAVLR